MADKISDKTDCCGCGACAQVCPAGCIQMYWDGEGFLYPRINKAGCIGCNQCHRACPVERATDGLALGSGFVIDGRDMPAAYGGWHKDRDVRYGSSSGGAFSLFAEYVISQGGIVFGCALDRNMRAVHKGAESVEELAKLRGSKYTQSDVGDTYIQVKRELERKRKVLFTGTPCQAAGLHAYLGKVYENLWTVDFICHGVPSPAVFERYVRQMEKKYGARMVSYQFRNKDHGWNQTGLQLGTRMEFANGKVVRKFPAYKDGFMNGFLDNLYLRPSCYACAFKEIPKYYADFTIADFWGVNRISRTLNDGKGTSLVLVHGMHGKKLWKRVCNNFKCKPVDFDTAVRSNRSILCSAVNNKDRDAFFNDFNNRGYPYAERKYLTAFKWARHKAARLVKGRG